MRPIIGFSKILPEIAEGDLTKRLAAGSGDELATLSASINSLLRVVASSISEIKKAGQENQDASAGLQGNCELISSSVQRIGLLINA